MMDRAVTLALDDGAAQPLFVDFVNTLHWYEGLPIELIGNTADLGLGASMSVILLLLAIIVALPLVAFLQHRERRLLA